MRGGVGWGGGGGGRVEGGRWVGGGWWVCLRSAGVVGGEREVLTALRAGEKVGTGESCQGVAGVGPRRRDGLALPLIGEEGPGHLCRV